MTSIRTEILEVLATVGRRRWLAIAVAWLICALGWATVSALPDQYSSETRLYVDTDSLLGPLLRGVAIENNLQRQVQVMQRTLLSRPNLQQVIASTDLSLKAKTPVQEQGLYDRLERMTTIKADGPNLFTIRYVDSDPVLARDVVQVFITILMENNAGQNRTDMEKARTFIERQIASYEDTLKTIERRLAEFQSKHIEELGSVGTNFSGRVDAATAAAAAARRELEDATARRDSLAAQLAVLPKFLEVQSAPQIIVNTGRGDPTQARLAELKEQLTLLRQRYTERHPDVVAAKRQLDDFTAEMKSQEAQGSGDVTTTTTKGRVSNPVYEQAQMRLLEAQQAVELATRHLAQAQAEEKRILALAGSAPAIENQFNDLKREYGVQKKQYEELLERRESARISEAVQNSSTRIQFRIIEAPTVPIRPAGPKRILFLAGVLGLGVAAGIGAALLANRIQDPVTTAEAVIKRFGFPVIGEVSVVKTAGHEYARRRRLMLTAVAISSLLLVFAVILASSMAKPGGNQLAWLTPHLEWFRDWMASLGLKVFE